MEFDSYMKELRCKKTQTCWKQFFTIYVDRFRSKPDSQQQPVTGFFGETQLIAFLRLYAKWVASINAF
jgi:hypothetical protein